MPHPFIVCDGLSNCEVALGAEFEQVGRNSCEAAVVSSPRIMPKANPLPISQIESDSSVEQFSSAFINANNALTLKFETSPLPEKTGKGNIFISERYRLHLDSAST